MKKPFVNSFIRPLAVSAFSLLLAGLAQADVHVEWDPADATTNIQAAVNTGDSKIVLDNHGAPWQTGPIFLDKPNQEIHFANGAKVMAIKGGYKGVNDSMFTVRADNVTLNGYANGVDTKAGTTMLEMRKADYQSDAYKKAEWRHVIYIGGFNNITVQGFTLKDSGGDGICVGRRHSQQTYAKDVVLRDIVSDGNHRQGLSVGSVVNLTVTNAVFKNTRGTAPQAGVDIEPDKPYNRLENIRFINCHFENNAWASVAIHLRQQFGTESKDVSIEFIDCLLEGGGPGIYLTYLLPEGPGGYITFKNCRIRNTRDSGIQFSAWSHGKLKVTFDNVSIQDSAQKAGFPVSFRQKTPPLWGPGNVEFKNGFRIEDSKPNRDIIVEGAALHDVGFKDITGSIEVTAASPTAKLIDLGSKLENVTLEVKQAQGK